VDEAPVVVGVHGLAGNGRVLDRVGERLGRAGMQFVAMDLRGRGRSEATGPGTYGWENHALDVFAVADALGAERFSVVGQSMGGAVAMKAAELDTRDRQAEGRLEAVVLVDIAGRVDPGVGPVIAEVIAGLDEVHGSVDDYLAAVRAQGLVEPWSEHWDRCYRYGLERSDQGVRSSTDPEAVAEDRRYTLTQDPYERWKHLTMPTLLVRATRELRPGAGFVVPADDKARFLREVPRGTIVEVDANHLTAVAHDEAIDAIRRFLVVG
jgi:pimeloyl-ACP methyl ester carboxylesterase